MDDIKSLKEYLLTIYPVRKTAAQKAECRKWLLRELKRAGWRAQEETYGRANGSVNVVAGDPDRAALFLCTHYDTAARMLAPDFVSPTNVAAHVAYHLVVALALVVAAFLAALAVSFPLGKPELMLPLFLILAVAALAASAYGPANKNNANGNSSGVLALLDNNERNLLGAAAFKKRHIERAGENLFIHLDCVGDGDNLLLLPSKHSRWDAALLEAIQEAFPEEDGMHPRLRDKGLHYYPSDNRKFRFHVAVCACRYLAGLGYYIPHLRTKKDTVLEERNIAYIARCMARFVPLYLDAE